MGIEGIHELHLEKGGNVNQTVAGERNVSDGLTLLRREKVNDIGHKHFYFIKFQASATLKEIIQELRLQANLNRKSS